MLASDGYPWTVIRVEDREPTSTLESPASTFAKFIAERVQWSMKKAAFNVSNTSRDHVAQDDACEGFSP